MIDYHKGSGLKPVPFIAFTGARGSGKDEAAKALSWQKTAFAVNPKRVAGLIYGLGGHFMDDAVKDKPVWETLGQKGFMLPESWKSKNTTSRDVTRAVAEGLKEITGNRYLWALSWMNTFYTRACLEGNPIILTDLRFPEEEDLIRGLHPTVIHVVGRGKRDDHVSDVPLPVRDGDYVIENNRSIKYLHDRVRSIVIGTYGAIPL